MACPLVGCSLVKKGVLGAALGAGALYMAFGTSAPSYVRTAFNGVRSSAKSAVPIEFEIRRAREEVANLEPAIKRNIAEIAQADVDVKDLSDEVASTKANLASAKADILSRREKLDSGDFRLAGGSTSNADELKTDLARRLDSYRSTSKLLENKEASLKAKQKSLEAAKAQLQQMAAVKKQLVAKIDEIESRQKLIQVTKESREFNFDDSALANVKQTVTELAKRLDKEARIAEMEGKYSDGLSISTETGRDVAKELDTEFGPAPKKAVDKSL
jgi:chromosome segregation ATPase